jgi:hypothetical protein
MPSYIHICMDVYVYIYIYIYEVLLVNALTYCTFKATNCYFYMYISFLFMFMKMPISGLQYLRNDMDSNCNDHQNTECNDNTN